MGIETDQEPFIGPDEAGRPTANPAEPMRWFAEYRVAWIKESVEIFGTIRREHIMKKFGVSSAQASMDLRFVRERWPDLIQYDLSEKIYKAAAP